MGQKKTKQAMDTSSLETEISSDEGVTKKRHRKQPRRLIDENEAESDHTLARQCESVVRATTQVNGKTGNSTPCHPRTP